MNRALFWVLAIGAVLAFGYALTGREGLLTPEEDASVGTPDLGGPFTLVNGAGETVTDADFRGRYMLVYFGYTFCPDVCPTTLQIMGQALDKLGEAGKDVVPVFISVDPARDTPEVVGDYVRHFHERMVGLTGSEAQVAAAAKAYKVYYAKAEETTAGGGDDYLVDHSSIVFLMGPDGGYLAHFTHSDTAEEMAAGIRAHID
jgi:cytochrome oxidase Cu insertion factor (SCO1/SenC/PrrC family)